MATTTTTDRRAGGQQSTNRAGTGFTAEERAAMRERAHEAKTTARRSGRDAAAEGEKDLLAKIAEMPDADRVIATRLHELVTSTAPSLTSRTWYGMPAYAKDGSVVCFFKNASKFKTRYATLGFSDQANLDDGTMWPTEFAIIKLDERTEKQIVDLVKRAVA